MKSRMQKGFTLVEIAIVLVIVGLLIGGVLKGQEMITNAKLKRIESDNAGLAAAIFSYQDRYLQLPGDDSGASSRFDIYAPGGTPDTNVDGGGDGVIDGTWNANNGTTIGASSVESEKLFGHMRAAGLIPGGSGYETTRPTNAYGGQIGVQNGSLGMSGHVSVFGQIEGAIARILEARLDDNNRATGRMRGDVSGSGGDMSANNVLSPTTDKAYDDAERYDLAFRL